MTLFSAILVAAAGCIGVALGDCECGYSISGDDAGYQVFTDLLESDFLHTNYLDSPAADTGWARQTFNMTKELARGTYGEAFVAANAISNEIKDDNVWTGDGRNGGAGGLQLVVSSEVVDDSVQTAEVATMGTDYFYGTFRAGIKVTDVVGTCSAFFWYFNDTQEIDMEFLSAEFNTDNSSFPVNLVLQTPQSRRSGYDASKTGTFDKVNLPFNPTDDFHEYRFDFLADKVLFYADGALLTSMSGSAVPTSSGNILLSHWSNGNSGWSQGPPTEDAVTTLSYVKAYYNSTKVGRERDYTKRCTDPAGEGAVCAIPENDATFFFMYQKNMTGNQTTFQGDDSAAGSNSWSPLVLVAALACSAWALGL
ncbi:concanavalin A-like lectin/glucanase domain-containing protein [Pseudomassariella vexata]|uniref:Concanavalin A-like lectin/glucanase domain-containing protein n=1 Tax=Pseudomassariella vexata TaxID=1141098 RepID=A0A1Y2EDN8_9PEZI|nr:concanavalin A-like lectin/glucanase domain-containing protein [Pseudomassariella vexata]ORY69682.1 concanavalin A-like lectin/glucanase domain-containing protein [Pseudomassariella vexata]